MSMNNLGLDDEFMATMLGDFLDESQGYLGRLNDNLLTLDELMSTLEDSGQMQVDTEILNEMFRDAHSLKGLSAMLQLENINALTHRVENVFDAARQGSLVISRDVIDLMFEAFDRLSGMVDNLSGETGEEIDYKGTVERIAALLQRAGVEAQHVSKEEISTIVGGDLEGAAGVDSADDSAHCQEDQVVSGVEERSVPCTANPLEGIDDEPNIEAKYLAIFLDETAESIDEIVELLIGESINLDELLVICHRIKGGAAAVGLNRAAKLVHLLEDALQSQRGRGENLPASSVNLVLVSVDSLKKLLAATKSGEIGEEEIHEACCSVQEAVAALERSSAGELEEPAAETPTQVDSAVEDRPTDSNGSVAQAVEGQGAESGTSRHAEEKPLTQNSPSIEVAEQSSTTSKSAVSGGQPAGVKNSTTQAADRPAETVRVDIDRLDQLMNLAGQLVINKARFGQIGEKLKELSSRRQTQQCLHSLSATMHRLQVEAQATNGDASLVQTVMSAVQQMERDLEVVNGEISKHTKSRYLANELNEAVHQLDHVADGIQKSVMNTRMVPIGPLFNRFKRVIRDITRGNGRDIKLIIRGEKTELDKRMIDELSDPLIHMVRNSADHGIEPPEDRLASDKPGTGSITLDAYHRGNRIIIEVKDDGKGLDPEKIRAKAVAKGIITAQEAERLTNDQTYQLIWEPGFSTAEQVTEVSGRGMGMDIVRAKIEQINGTVELHSQPGEGTTITIKLPLTLAILPSLLTTISGDVFAIPVESVVEIVRVESKDLSTVHGASTARVRGRVISVLELDDLLHWSEGGKRRTSHSGDRILVIIGTDDKELGLSVDGLLGEEDIVIKSLAENYHNVTGLSGASILGDGRVSLILDVGALIDLACKKQHQSEPGSHRPYCEPAETKLTSDITEPLGDGVSAEGAKS